MYFDRLLYSSRKGTAGIRPCTSSPFPDGTKCIRKEQMDRWRYAAGESVFPHRAMQRNISNLQNCCTAKKKPWRTAVFRACNIRNGLLHTGWTPLYFFVLSGYFTKESGQTLISIASKAWLRDRRGLVAVLTRPDCNATKPLPNSTT